MHAKMTLLGTERYLNNQSKSLADQLSLPVEGYDPELLLSTMIRKYSSLPTLYEDPDYFYEETGYWWKIHKSEYAKMYAVMAAEYSPLENYDRYEDIEVLSDGSKENSGSATTNTSSQSTESITGTDRTTTTDSSTGSSTTVVDGTVGVESSDTAETKVSAFNESAYQPSSKVETNSGSTTDTDSTTTTTTTSSANGSVALSKDTNDATSATSNGATLTSGTEEAHDKTTTKSHLHGNIGVTRSQEMLIEELKVRMSSVYGMIAARFADDMLIGLW